MNCLILAAGKNTRLDMGIPKSLVDIEGETLMERHFRVFSSLGVKNFCVISGHRAEWINKEVPVFAEKYGVEVSILHNPRFDLENGFSVYRAKEWVKKNEIKRFFLTMGDHIFDPGFIEEYIKKISGQKHTLDLAVDIPGSSNDHVDIDDVTKVLTDKDGYIENIGKTIKNYTHYDTGLFHLKAKVFKAFSKSFDQGKFTISDTVNRLVEAREAKVSIVPGYTWNDVDNLEDLKTTKELLNERSF